MTIRFVAVALLVICLGVPATASCGGGSDASQVEALIRRLAVAANREDWRMEYDMLTPNARSACAYEQYRREQEETWDEIYSYLGRAEVAVSDISVMTVIGPSGEFEYALATFKVKYGDAIFPTDKPEIYRKVNGKWYGVVNDPSDCGYNTADLRDFPSPPG